MGTGIIIISIGMMFIFGNTTVAGKVLGGIVIIFGLIYIWSVKESNKSKKLEMEEASIDRSENILAKIGGIDNIDINLSKYGDDSQLIILKNKSILIGYNNYETEKIITFDSIVKLEIRINNAKVGTAYQYVENKVKEIVESIIVYIHTNECTEELIFKYSAYETEQAQIKYNEILKGLKRLKIMLGDTLYADNLDKKAIINIKEKSIPEQIKKYKELLDIDAITKEEYEALKKDFLSKLRA